MNTHRFGTRLAVFLFVVPLWSCARVSKTRTPTSKVVKTWKLKGELGQTQIEVIPKTAMVDSPVFQGQIARTRHCEVSDFTETEERTEHEGELRQGVGAYLGSVGTTGTGIGMLAASKNASDEPEAGGSTSPKTQLQVMGTTATVVGGIWLAHTLYQTARSMDRTERHKNQIDKKVSDQICQATPIPGASIALSSPDLGIEHPVPLEPTDGTGNFRVDLTKIRGFQWPAVAKEKLTVVMHLDGGPLNNQPLGDWTLEWAKKLDECSSEATCLAVGETALRHGDAYERVAERAQKVADFYKYGSAIDVVSQSYRKVSKSLRGPGAVLIQLPHSHLYFWRRCFLMT